MQINLILPSNYFPCDAQKYQDSMNNERKMFQTVKSLKTSTFLFHDISSSYSTVPFGLLYPCNSPEECSKDAAKINILLLSINCYK